MGAVDTNYTFTGTPTGNVTVRDHLGNSCTATVAEGTCSLTFAEAGAYRLTAHYAGDGNFDASFSGEVRQEVLDFTIAVRPTEKSIRPGDRATYELTLRKQPER